MYRMMEEQRRQEKRMLGMHRRLQDTEQWADGTVLRAAIAPAQPPTPPWDTWYGRWGKEAFDPWKRTRTAASCALTL